jgi:hypothetical protein
MASSRCKPRGFFLFRKAKLIAKRKSIRPGSSCACTLLLLEAEPPYLHACTCAWKWPRCRSAHNSAPQPRFNQVFAGRPKQARAARSDLRVRRRCLVASASLPRRESLRWGHAPPTHGAPPKVTRFPFGGHRGRLKPGLARGREEYVRL